MRHVNRDTATWLARWRRGYRGPVDGVDGTQVTRVPCVGAIVVDERGRLLMIRRGTDPGRGLWSVPGGRVEPGESSRDAVVREVEEETHVRITPTGLAGVVERPGAGGIVYVIEDWFARVEAGTDPGQPTAGDDASEAAWFLPEQVEQLDCVPGLLEVLREWLVVPPQR